MWVPFCGWLRRRHKDNRCAIFGIPSNKGKPTGQPHYFRLRVQPKKTRHTGSPRTRSASDLRRSQRASGLRWILRLLTLTPDEALIAEAASKPEEAGGRTDGADAARDGRLPRFGLFGVLLRIQSEGGTFFGTCLVWVSQNRGGPKVVGVPSRQKPTKQGPPSWKKEILFGPSLAECSAEWIPRH